MIHSDYVFENTIRYLKKNDSNKWNGLIQLIKQIDDSNPFDTDKDKDKSLMWQEQCNINFPILYLASIYLYIYAKRRKCNTFLFSTRDCCNWHKIFQQLFPDMKVHYFNCSRNMFEVACKTKNIPFKQYIKSLFTDLNETVYVDLHGTGKRMFAYFEKEFDEVPHCFLLSATYKNYDGFPAIAKYYYDRKKFCNLVFDANGSPIEMLNYDLVGTLQNYTTEGPIRDDLEYSLKRVKPYHDCIEHCVENLDSLVVNYSNDSSSLDYNLNDLQKLIEKIFKCIKHTKPSISKHIRHIGKHKKNKLKDDSPNKNFKVTRHGDKKHADKNNKVKSNKDTNLINYKKNNKISNDLIMDKHILKKFEFDRVISDNTTYGLIWEGSYEGKVCIIKMIMLKSGAHHERSTSDLKYFDYNDKDPFRHRDFKNRKSMTINDFLQEAKELTNLYEIGLAPEVYGYWICNKMYNVHYGFIAMEKMDYSLKHILAKRSLKKDENQLIENIIDELHENDVVHGDLKPSNIGVMVNGKGKITKCLLFDCQKVKHKENYHHDVFDKLIERDWHTYKKHSVKNKTEKN